MAVIKLSATNDTVAHRIRTVRAKLFPGELAVIDKLLADYPVAGLSSVNQLASAAGVSGPTVLRLVGKLGYSGYPAFQQALRSEVSARLFSPVDYYPEKSNKESLTRSENLINARNVFIEGLRKTFDQIYIDEIYKLIDLLADPNRSIITMGGRFSSILAVHLGTYIAMLRPGVQVVGAHPDAPLPALLDVNKRTVVVLFDYRRYQRSTVDWGINAVKRGAHVVLITDQYLSPLATHAQSVFRNSSAGLPPFDSMASAFALVELIISFLAERLGKPARKRLSDFETMRIHGEGAIERPS